MDSVHRYNRLCDQHVGDEPRKSVEGRKGGPDREILSHDKPWATILGVLEIGYVRCGVVVASVAK